MIPYLARRSWGRIVLIPVLLGFDAWSWASYLLGGGDAVKRAKLRHCWGWLSPEMRPHWDRLADPKHPEYLSAFHSGKNIVSEVCRLDAERAGKALSFLLAVALLAGIAIGLSACATGKRGNPIVQPCGSGALFCVYG